MTISHRTIGVVALIMSGKVLGWSERGIRCAKCMSLTVQAAKKIHSPWMQQIMMRGLLNSHDPQSPDWETWLRVHKRRRLKQSPGTQLLGDRRTPHRISVQLGGPAFSG
jgi:hypothetical protein